MLNVDVVLFDKPCLCRISQGRAFTLLVPPPFAIFVFKSRPIYILMYTYVSQSLYLK